MKSTSVSSKLTAPMSVFVVSKFLVNIYLFFCPSVLFSPTELSVPFFPTSFFCSLSNRPSQFTSLSFHCSVLFLFSPCLLSTDEFWPHHCSLFFLFLDLCCYQLVCLAQDYDFLLLIINYNCILILGNFLFFEHLYMCGINFLTCYIVCTMWLPRWLFLGC